MFQDYLQYYLKKTAWIAVHFILFLILARFFVGEAGRISGTSMEPTLHDGQLFWVNKIKYAIQSPQRFDIVQLYNPAQPTELLVKRIVGMPGDTVVWTESTMVITTPAQEQFKINLPADKEMMTNSPEQTLIVPALSYFVLGDHFTLSSDSRVFGAVHRRWINGKVLSLPL